MWYPEQKYVSSAKWLASSYFIILLILDIGHIMLYGRQIYFTDFVVFITFPLPLLINNKYFYAGFGLFHFCFALYLLFIFFHFHTKFREGAGAVNPDPELIRSILIRYLILIPHIIFSLLMLYVAKYMR